MKIIIYYTHIQGVQKKFVLLILKKRLLNVKCGCQNVPW